MLEKQTVKRLKNDLAVKSADKLLTILSAPQTQTGVNIQGKNTAKKSADRGRGERQKNQQPRNIIELLSQKKLSKLAKSTLKSYNLIKKQYFWRGNLAIPPQNFIENVVSIFKNETDIPLEIPFFLSLNFVAAELLRLNVSIDFSDQTIKSDIWTVILAESGSSKTFATNVFEKAIEPKNLFDSGIQSAAKFIEELQKNNNGFWIRDEFAQLLKAMKTQSYLEEMPDYLLKAYDNQTISRKTLKNEIIVKDPALVFFGMNVYSTYLLNISAEELLDGSAQRFNYVIAEPDPARPDLSVPLYPFKLLKNTVKKSWKKLKFPMQNKKYILGTEAIKAFEEFFHNYCSAEAAKIPGSFLRRTLFKSLKYALIYHILLGKTNRKEIDADDISWGMRVILIHISDTKKLLENYGFSDLEKIIQKVENLKKKFAAQGKQLKTRDVIANIREIRTVHEANAILEISK